MQRSFGLSRELGAADQLRDRRADQPARDGCNAEERKRHHDQSPLHPDIMAVPAARREAEPRRLAQPPERLCRAGDVRVEMRNTAFLEKTLTAQGGSISVAVANHDLFWHTFTIDALHVNVDAPIGANRRVTFDAAPGRYEFYCRVPGHRAAGMHGILIVT